jgi:hypothetical protein
VILTDCTFQGNLARAAGDAISTSYNSDLTIANCRFLANYVSGRERSNGTYSYGGALISYESVVSLANCLFVGNSALQGGALGSVISEIIIINCTFTDNYATQGHTRHCYHFNPQSLPSTVQVRNCIVRDAQNSMINPYGEIIIASSNILGGWPGLSNIDIDPCFVDPGYWDPNGTPEDVNDDFWVHGDYHLKSQAGRWDSNDRRWTIDDVTSPCIDAGDPMAPIGYEPFPNGGIINMGAYGGTAEAGKSYFGEPPCEIIIAGDINADCRADFLDFRLMGMHWLEDNGL